MSAPGRIVPGESPEYRAARDRLLEQEIELRRSMEAVAAARRALPPGGPVPTDYVFRELRRTGGSQTYGCPSCSPRARTRS